MPPGRPFLTALAEALLAGHLPSPDGARPDPMQLADVTLLLPTRRATRALQEAFLAAGDGRALLLPRVKPIIGSAEDPLLFASAQELAEGGGEIDPPISEIGRQLALAMLVLRWSEAERRGIGPEADIGAYMPTAARTPAQAARLARELARLMDAMEIEDVDYARMQSLVPDTFAAHWERTLEFLRIVTEHWPAHLAQHGLVSKMQRDKQQVLALAQRWREAPPVAPVIVAGVMSSAPVVTELLRVVAGLPNGALVLPGLDQSLDAESWDTIVPAHPEHPQFGLKKLLDALEVRREDVLPLPGVAPTAAERQRAHLVSESMRPARTTERWHQFTAAADAREMAQAVAGLAVLEAPSGEDEAEAVALILREAVETPGRTAALVTPDRQLARRVAVRLEAWGLQVDDSAGQPFAKTMIGALLDLAVEATARRFAPLALVALLKHPLCRLGMAPAELRKGVRTLELAAFRTPYFGEGLVGVAAALERAEADLREGRRRHRAVRRLAPDDWKAAGRLVEELGRVFRPLEAMFATSEKTPLAAIARAHVETVQALAAAGGDAASPWQGEAGDQASRFFAALIDPSAPAPAMAAADYPEFYRSLVAEETIRSRGAVHPRLFIWEPYESRLQQPDVVILGSLNEGTWPQAADPGPWLNRPMRAALGLPAPEERIGDAAHIFTSLLGVDRVYLTRAAKIDGVPTVPSRWLLRLQALLGGLGVAANADKPWLAWAHARNAPAGPVRPVAAPEPRPALALRPRKLSVTAIEKWIANPYAIFAQRILELEPLPMLGRPPDAALRGQIVHDALGRFAVRYPQVLPEDVCGELVALAKGQLAQLTGSPRVAAFWAPRFARFAAWFAETERARREGVDRVLAEVEGALVLAGSGKPFTLTARADRIDVTAKGLVITDYKTGGNVKDLAGRAGQGEAPQLPLEAAIATAGNFTGLPQGPVTALRYISGSGGEPAGQEALVKNGSAAQMAKAAREGLERLVAAYDNEATPYRALRRARFTYRYDDYAHLARVAEWSAETDEEV